MLLGCFFSTAPETDGPSLFGAKIAWRYPGGSGFQWEMCNLSRCRFNVWVGLVLLDKKKKTLQSPNKRTEISTRASAASAELPCASFRQQHSSKD